MSNVPEPDDLPQFPETHEDQRLWRLNAVYAYASAHPPLQAAVRDLSQRHKRAIAATVERRAALARELFEQPEAFAQRTIHVSQELGDIADPVERFIAEWGMPMWRELDEEACTWRLRRRRGALDLWDCLVRYAETGRVELIAVKHSEMHEMPGGWIVPYQPPGYQYTVRDAIERSKVRAWKREQVRLVRESIDEQIRAIEAEGAALGWEPLAAKHRNSMNMRRMARRVWLAALDHTPEQIAQTEYDDLPPVLDPPDPRTIEKTVRAWAADLDLPLALREN